MAQARKLHDEFFKRAKAEGYVARSAYKLIEIDDRRKLLRAGDRVLDLGCSPGSWLQVVAQRIGPRGLCVGVDLKPVSPDLGRAANTRTLVADVFDLTPELIAAELARAAGRDPAASHALRFNVILSDMAPSTEGGAGGTVDHLRSIQLCRRVLALATTLLLDRGSLVMKVFEGEHYPALLKETGAVFAQVTGFKPDSSRDVSREMFIVAKGFKADRAATPVPTPPGVAKAAPAPRPGWGAPNRQPRSDER
jgi:23S rRNA (uridine2552-2'-O)-methyltransferase